MDALLIGRTVKAKALQTEKFTAQHTQLPDGIEATDTATCYDCREGQAHPEADGWTCHDCGAMWAYDEGGHPGRAGQQHSMPAQGLSSRLKLRREAPLSIYKFSRVNRARSIFPALSSLMMIVPSPYDHGMK